MSSLQDLISRKDAIEKEIEDTRKKDRSEAISKVRELMNQYGLTMSDLTGRKVGRPAGVGGSKVAPKYRNSATGDTWSGRGLRPKWLTAALATGKNLDDFRV
jgi:DNA-binding protein H-NS